MLYRPSLFVVVDVGTWVATFVAVTWTPTTTAPLGSVTRPLMLPVMVWPNAIPQRAINEKASERVVLMRIWQSSRNL
jgi:hypothetical protein